MSKVIAIDSSEDDDIWEYKSVGRKPFKDKSRLKSKSRTAAPECKSLKLKGIISETSTSKKVPRSSKLKERYASLDLAPSTSSGRKTAKANRTLTPSNSSTSAEGCGMNVESVSVIHAAIALSASEASSEICNDGCLYDGTLVAHTPTFKTLSQQCDISRQLADDIQGFCPVCQMPFLCLFPGQTIDTHVAECLEWQQSESIIECKHGSDCDAVDQAHFKLFSHTVLAQARAAVERTGKESDRLISAELTKFDKDANASPHDDRSDMKKTCSLNDKKHSPPKQFKEECTVDESDSERDVSSMLEEALSDEIDSKDNYKENEEQIKSSHDKDEDICVVLDSSEEEDCVSQLQEQNEKTPDKKSRNSSFYDLSQSAQKEQEEFSKSSSQKKRQRERSKTTRKIRLDLPGSSSQGKNSLISIKSGKNGAQSSHAVDTNISSLASETEQPMVTSFFQRKMLLVHPISNIEKSSTSDADISTAANSTACISDEPVLLENGTDDTQLSISDNDEESFHTNTQLENQVIHYKEMSDDQETVDEKSEILDSTSCLPNLTGKEKSMVLSAETSTKAGDSVNNSEVILSDGGFLIEPESPGTACLSMVDCKSRLSPINQVCGSSYRDDKPFLHGISTSEAHVESSTDGSSVLKRNASEIMMASSKRIALTRKSASTPSLNSKPVGKNACDMLMANRSKQSSHTNLKKAPSSVKRYPESSSKPPESTTAPPPPVTDNSSTFNNRKCPFYKKIPDTSFTVDAFRYGDIPGCTSYFLSHFHYDHYMGLKKKFKNTMYCSPVTANLVKAKIRVDAQYIHTIPLETPTVIEGTQVTFLEANHCPGAVLILFRLKNGRTILHTGDFRANRDMELYPSLIGQHVQSLYLDTTYCDPTYSFPPQDDAIKFGIKLVQRYRDNNPKTLIVCGSYTIGKERVFTAIAEALDCKICVTRDKKSILDCLENSDLTRRISMNWSESGLHILPMNKLKQQGLEDHLSTNGKQYNSVLALEPTGWTFSKNLLSLDQIKPKYERGKITIFGIPYSEHSSYLEMKRFVQHFRPDKILPTVNNGNVHSRRKMEVIFESWMQEVKQEGNKCLDNQDQGSVSDWVTK